MHHLLGIKSATPFSIMLLKTPRSSIMFYILQRVYKHILNSKDNALQSSLQSHMGNFGWLLWENHKNYFLSPNWVQKIHKSLQDGILKNIWMCALREERGMRTWVVFLLNHIRSRPNKLENNPHRSKFEYYCSCTNTWCWKITLAAWLMLKLTFRYPCPKGWDMPQQLINKGHW